MNPQDSITQLKGVGQQRELKLNKLGIYTIEDLINHYPRDYKDRTQLVEIANLVPDEENTFIGMIDAEGQSSRKGRVVFTRLRVSDETGKVSLIWYNQPYMATALKIGEQYLFTGKLQSKFGRKEIVSPEYEYVGENFAGGRIIPIYPSVEGLSQKMLRGFIEEVLHQEHEKYEENIPLWVRKNYHIAERNFAIQNIHFPKIEQSFYDARFRLIFEEFFLLQGALYALKGQIVQDGTGIVMKKPKELERFKELLPFTLTNAQQKVLGEVSKDMKSGRVMNRLIQGDVGSGKTAVAMAASYWTIKNGYQAVLMAPTEVLAEQHYHSFQELFSPIGIEVVRLTGSMKAKEKREALEKIATGNGQMVIGTHAVIQKGVEFRQLGLAITDEQHRFGVRQRSALSEKGETPHTLVMTATPIPRTLALILYGDLDISIIDELPPGRKEIDTLAVTPAYHPRIYSFIQKEVGLGRQCYVVCPMIEESEKLEVQAVLTYTEELQNELKECRVRCIHGKMKGSEKQEIMEQFTGGELDVLVSTTVIEVGINVPNATLMLIENAERFGLAQLHQLRGRVGRGADKSYCILVSESKTQLAKARLKAMVETRDGFIISETDLKLRGPGEFFGTRQHGLPELKIANLYRDIEILKQAQEAVAQLYHDDPQLEKEENQGIKRYLSNILDGKTLEI